MEKWSVWHAARWRWKVPVALSHLMITSCFSCSNYLVGEIALGHSLLFSKLPECLSITLSNVLLAVKWNINCSNRVKSRHSDKMFAAGVSACWFAWTWWTSCDHICENSPCISAERVHVHFSQRCSVTQLTIVMVIRIWPQHRLDLENIFFEPIHVSCAALTVCRQRESRTCASVSLVVCHSCEFVEIFEFRVCAERRGRCVV